MKFNLNLGEAKLGEATVQNINISVECSLAEMAGSYELVKQAIKEAPELFENLNAIQETCDRLNINSEIVSCQQQ